MGFAFFNRNISRCLFGALLASLVLVAYPAAARNCTPDEKAEADKKLWLNKRDTKAAIGRHLPAFEGALPRSLVYDRCRATADLPR